MASTNSFSDIFYKLDYYIPISTYIKLFNHLTDLFVRYA